MTDLNLAAKTRSLERKKTKSLRKQGQIPAVLYGHEVAPQSLSVDQRQFEKIYKQAGGSTLLNLVIDKNQPIKVLIQEVQKDSVSNNFLHIDFHQVRMDEKLRTEVKLKFIGEPTAVKELSGILVTNIDTLEIECLPQYLVYEIEIDLSGLKTFSDLIHVSDIKIPEGITILNPADEVVALVQPPREEKELEALTEKPVEELPEEVKEEEAVETEGEKRADGGKTVGGEEKKSKIETKEKSK